MRSDPRFLSRVAGHGAVVALTLAVVVVSQVGAVPIATGGKGSTVADLAQMMRLGARSFAPEPVLDTDADSYQGGDGGSAMPGFISAGPVPEADPSLLPWDEPQRYVVQYGDTVTDIAARFSLAPETLLYANPDIRDDPHNLSIGDELTILPVDGVLHVVDEGDTVVSIADEYEASAKDIVGYTPNGVRSVADALVPGTTVVVPGGAMDVSIPPLVRWNRSSQVWAPGPNYGGPAVGSGAVPVATFGRITQWFSRWHPAIDIANGYGTPLYAVDTGTVEVAGWYGWAGNAVVIDHGNGYETLYAHLQSVGVSRGQTVQRGQIVGGMGCTRGRGGRCT
ncbi:MAG: peptidoglycan DD-metalloendopeptidase family protein, partial [Anaerolineae bacterium]